MRRFIRTTINIARQKLKKNYSLLNKNLSGKAKHLVAATSPLINHARKVTKRKQYKSFRTFVQRYSTQLAFAFIIATFLVVTVGEGQAFEVDTPRVVAQIEEASDQFIGKPQLYAGQTLLTGEVQELLAINYTVEPGDSLLSIANRYDISVGTIVDANNIAADEIENIHPGTDLLIPSKDTDKSLAWLDDVNKVKAEQERQRQAQINSSRQSSFARVNLAQSIGNYSVLGRYTNLGNNGGVPGQCTWYVLSRRTDLPSQMGNGGQYLASARRYGIPTGSIARVGAVIVTSESGWGHVGIVTGVSGSNVTVTEMNYVAPFVVSQRTISAYSGVIRGYVY